MGPIFILLRYYGLIICGECEKVVKHWLVNNMKFKEQLIVFTLLLVIGENTLARDDLVSVSLDSSYYFIDSSERELEIVVESKSKNLAGVKVLIYEGERTNTGIEFKLDEVVGDFDVYPSKFLLQAGKQKKLKLLRQRSSNANEEKIYRIRAIPTSAREWFKNNPKMLSLASKEEKMIYEESLLASEVKLSIGAGSLLISQPNDRINRERIRVFLDNGVTIKNSNEYTIHLSDVHVNENDRIQNFTILGGSKATRKIENFEKIKSISFKNQYEDVIDMDCIDNICIDKQVTNK